VSRWRGDAVGSVIGFRSAAIGTAVEAWASADPVLSQRRSARNTGFAVKMAPSRTHPGHFTEKATLQAYQEISGLPVTRPECAEVDAKVCRKSCGTLVAPFPTQTLLRKPRPNTSYKDAARDDSGRSPLCILNAGCD
jgi:hypothetical protein